MSAGVSCMTALKPARLPACPTCKRYFEGLDPDRRSALEETWNTARRHAPDAEEAISYGMPTLKYKRRPLLGMAASARHLIRLRKSEIDEPAG